MSDDKHRAGLAAVLSFLFNGLGQIYNGKIKKGLFIISLSAVSMILIIVGAVLICYWLMTDLINLNQFILGIILFFLGMILAGIVGIRSIFDAYNGN